MTIYPYGLWAAAGAAAMILWAWMRSKDPEERKATEWAALIGIPTGVILAHLGYCLCNLDWISDYFWEAAIDFPGGGYLLYGGMAGMVIGILAAGRKTGTDAAGLADRLAAPFLLFTAALTAGEGWIGAGYGWKVEDWFQAESGMSLFTMEDVSFFSRFPFATADRYYGYANWAVFLPIAIGLAIGSLLLARKSRRGGKPGGTAVLAGEIYACIRIFYESLRQDDILKWGFVRVNQILSAGLILILMLLCYMLIRREETAAGGAGMIWKSLGIFAGGVVISGAMEFALEKKIGFLEWMPMDLCYVLSAAGCALLFLSGERMRKKAFRAG